MPNRLFLSFLPIKNEIITVEIPKITDKNLSITSDVEKIFAQRYRKVLYNGKWISALIVAIMTANKEDFEISLKEISSSYQSPSGLFIKRSLRKKANKNIIVKEIYMPFFFI